jgi:hypothetical protein
MKAALKSKLEPTPKEARRTQREKVRLPATVLFAGGALRIDCFVTELSTLGAKLELPLVIASLETLELAIPERNLKRRARVVWRRGVLSGVKFEPDVAEKRQPTFEEFAKLSKLEAERVKLTARIAALQAEVRKLTEEY